MEGITKAQLDRLEAAALGPGPLRPRDAGTLILLDRKGGEFHVLMGRRHRRHAFMPGKFVFPGGRTDPADSRVIVASGLHPHEEAKLTAGAGRTSLARARAIALSAIMRRPESAGRTPWSAKACHSALPAAKGPFSPISRPASS